MLRFQGDNFDPVYLRDFLGVNRHKLNTKNLGSQVLSLTELLRIVDR